MIKKITVDTEIYWPAYYVYALNLSTMVFENTSGIGAEENLVIVSNLHDNDFEIAQDKTELELNTLRKNGYNIVYALYTYNHYLIGYAYNDK